MPEIHASRQERRRSAGRCRDYGVNRGYDLRSRSSNECEATEAWTLRVRPANTPRAVVTRRRPQARTGFSEGYAEKDVRSAPHGCHFVGSQRVACGLVLRKEHVLAVQGVEDGCAE